MASKKLHCTHFRFRGKSVFQCSQISWMKGEVAGVFIDVKSFPLGLPACLAAPVLILRDCLFSLFPVLSPQEYTAFKVIIAKVTFQ